MQLVTCVITFSEILSTLVFAVQRVDQRRQGYFVEEKGYALIIKSLEAVSVSAVMECAFTCLRKERCESFNYKHGKKIENCVINSETKDTARESYIALSDYSYFEPHKVPNSVRYFMKKGQFSCSEICQSHGLLCAETDHGFPRDSALVIFKQLGVDCTHGFKVSDRYRRKVHPLYFSTPGRHWSGRCVGFKGIPEKINCSAKNKRNPENSRLCPCK